MGKCKCSACGYEFKANEGLYNTPIGLFCCTCYNTRGGKKKVYDHIRKQPPMEINLGKMALLSVGIDNRPKNISTTYKFVRILVNDILMPSWYFLCDNKTDVYYFFEKYYQPIIKGGVNKYMFGDTDTYWGNTILRMSESPKYRNLSPCVISSQLENLTYINRCESVENGDILLFNKSDMGYLKLSLKNVKIIQEKVVNNMVFPDEEKYDINDIVIKRWDDGIHYYAKVGKFDIISSNGEVKYNTYAEAHAECLKWLEKQ